MPVLFHCSCGKQLRVPDDYIGRRIKCPKCGEAQTVTGDEETNGTAARKGAVKAAAQPAAGGSAGVIRFECGECGKQMQTKAEFAGRSTRCPACKAAVTVPDQEEEAEDEEEPRARIQAGKPAPRAARAAREDEEEDDRPRKKKAVVDDDEEEDYDEDRPKKKGKKAVKSGGKGLLIGIIVGVVLLLLGGGGFAVWMMVKGGGSASDLVLVPQDCQVVAAIRVADLWKTPQVTELVAQLPPDAKKEMDQFTGKVGLTAADVERVLIVAQNPDAQKFWVVFTLSKPVDRKKFLEAIEADPAERKHQNKVYHVSKRDPQQQAAHFLSDKMVVFAPEVGIKACLDQLASGKSYTGKLSGALSQMSGPKQVVVGFIPPPDQVRMGKQMLQGQFAKYASLLDLQSGILTAQLSGNAWQVEWTATYPNEAGAKQAKANLEELKGMAKGLLGFAKLGGAGAGPEGKLLDELSKALDKLTVEQQGMDTLVKANVEVGASEVGNLFMKGFKQGAQGAASQNNLKQMGLAFHNYAGSNDGRCPPAVIMSKDGKNRPLYSWRLDLCPYMEAGEVWKRFNKNEPWDSPANLKLARENMPKVFEIPGRPAPPGHTYYKLFTGPQAVFDGGKAVIMPASFNIKGTSNTLLYVEAATSVFWTKPEDIPFDPKGNPGQYLGWNAQGQCNILMADGFVRPIKRTVSAASLKAVISPVDPNRPGPDF